MTAGLGMNVDLIKAMKQYKVNILTASDAHCPEDVGAFIPNMIHILNDIE